MVRQPQVFLMDEPLSNLDAKLRMSMRAEIIKLHRDVGGTFVYVTHDQIEAMTMGTKIALMRDGVVQQFGTPREIYLDPANTFVARFIGTPPMNLIEARLERGALRIGERNFALPAHLAGAASGDQPVLVGIRPNALTIVTGHDQALAGTVALVEHVGAESVIDVRLDHATTAHREEGEGRNEVMITESGYSDLHANDVVSVAVDLSEAVLFSPESGLRLRPASQAATARRVN
jgi:multiple sugar transport system ATP-binding protein